MVVVVFVVAVIGCVVVVAGCVVFCIKPSFLSLIITFRNVQLLHIDKSRANEQDLSIFSIAKDLVDKQLKAKMDIFGTASFFLFVYYL